MRVNLTLRVSLSWLFYTSITRLKTIAPFFQMPQDNRVPRGYLYMSKFTKYNFVECFYKLQKKMIKKIKSHVWNKFY